MRANKKKSDKAATNRTLTLKKMPNLDVAGKLSLIQTNFRWYSCSLSLIQLLTFADAAGNKKKAKR